jgi:formiminoglutamase
MDELAWQNNYKAPCHNIWQGRESKSGGILYWYQKIEYLNLLNLQQENKHSKNSKDIPHFALLGFECDEGVKRNQGRPGAKNGPKAIRESLAKMPWLSGMSCNVIDAGNIIVLDNNLAEAQKALGSAVSKLQKMGYIPIVLGGGHETAWGHYLGLAEQEFVKNLQIINFDAHFDLRPVLEDGVGSSGSPFKQIADYCANNQYDFNYTVIGAQEWGNDIDVISAAESLGVNTIWADEIHDGLTVENGEYLQNVKTGNNPIYLSVCLDVFKQSLAPGVSAPQINGLNLAEFKPYFKYLISTGQVVSLDIVELAPPYDRDGQTARLAALIAAMFVGCFGS